MVTPTTQQPSAAQLAAQIRSTWGGNWDEGGVDRAQELGDLLYGRGIQTLGDLELLKSDQGSQLRIGDRTIGFAGDYNNDGSFGSKAGDYLQDTGDANSARVGWSARGDGNVSYNTGINPETGKIEIRPSWGRSSASFNDVINRPFTDTARLAGSLGASQDVQDALGAGPIGVDSYFVGQSGRAIGGRVGREISREAEKNIDHPERAVGRAAVVAAMLYGAGAYGGGAGAGGTGAAAAGEGAAAAGSGAFEAAAAEALAGSGNVYAGTAAGTNWGAVGNAALRSAAINGGTTAVRGGSLTDILRSAATGAVTGGAGGYISGLGYSPVVSQAATGAIGAAARGGDGGDILAGAALGGVNGAMSGWQPTGNQMADSAIRGGITSAVRGGDGQQILTGAANGAIGSLGRGQQTGANPQAGGTMSDLQTEYGADPTLGGVNYLGGNPNFNEASGSPTFDNLGGGYEGGNLTFDGQGLDYGQPSTLESVGSWLANNGGRMFAGGGSGGASNTQVPRGNNGGGYMDMMGLMLAGGTLGNMMKPDPANTTGQRAAGDANMAIGAQQRDLANQQITQQQQLFQQYQPMLQQLISSSLTSQGQAQGQGQDMWSSYLNTWKPVGEELASRSLEMASQGRIDQQANLAGSEAAGKYDRAMGETRRALIAAGANPEKIAALEAAGRLESARGVAGATATARREGENRSVALLDNAARFGSALPGQALAATQVAGQAGQQASSGFQSLADAALKPATAAAPLLNGAVNANSAAGSLFSNATAAEVASDIAANNSTLGGAGAGLQLWQMMNQPKP